MFLKSFISCLLLLPLITAAATNEIRAKLAEEILTEGSERRTELIRGFAEENDATVEQVLKAWRGGSSFWN